MADPLEQLLQQVESAMRAKRLVALAPIEAVERELANYRKALTELLAAEFAREHKLKRPASSTPQPAVCAEKLLAAVQALPELTTEQPSKDSEVREAKKSKTKTGASSIPDTLSLLAAAVTRGPIVILGGLKRQDRLTKIPTALQSSIEWIDTNRGGSHAIGNLAQRVRQRRVAGLIIIDGQVSHKHTDPILAATRDVDIPAAYAGKGGQNALLRAVLELEKMLHHST